MNLSRSVLEEKIYSEFIGGRKADSFGMPRMQSIISMDKNTLRRLMNFPGSTGTSSSEVCTNSRERFPVVKRKNNDIFLRSDECNLYLY